MNHKSLTQSSKPKLGFVNFLSILRPGSLQYSFSNFEMIPLSKVTCEPCCSPHGPGCLKAPSVLPNEDRSPTNSDRVRMITIYIYSSKDVTCILSFHLMGKLLFHFTVEIRDMTYRSTNNSVSKVGLKATHREKA